MNLSPAAQVATDARATRFQASEFAGRAQEVATVASRALTLVRFGKADATVCADLLRRISLDEGRFLPASLDLALLRTADELCNAR